MQSDETERRAVKHGEDEMKGGRIEEEEKSMTVPVTDLINGGLGEGGAAWHAG